MIGLIESAILGRLKSRGIDISPLCSHKRFVKSIFEIGNHHFREWSVPSGSLFLHYPPRSLPLYISSYQADCGTRLKCE